MYCCVHNGYEINHWCAVAIVLMCICEQGHPFKGTGTLRYIYMCIVVTNFIHIYILLSITPSVSPPLSPFPLSPLPFLSVSLPLSPPPSPSPSLLSLHSPPLSLCLPSPFSPIFPFSLLSHFLIKIYILYVCVRILRRVRSCWVVNSLRRQGSRLLKLQLMHRSLHHPKSSAPPPLPKLPLRYQNNLVIL